MIRIVVPERVVALISVIVDVFVEDVEERTEDEVVGVNRGVKVGIGEMGLVGDIVGNEGVEGVDEVGFGVREGFDVGVGEGVGVGIGEGVGVGVSVGVGLGTFFCSNIPNSFNNLATFDSSAFSMDLT
jgi:hypothetical protein